MADFKEIMVDGQVYQVKDETARENQGGYEPPAGGIPKTDLASDVQTSLGKADTALQQSDKTQLQNAINSLQSALNTITQDGATQGVIDTFNEVKAFLDGIDTDDPTLANQLLALNNAISAVQTSLDTKANSADVYSKSEVDGKVAEAGSGAVSVTTNQDGTFTIHVGETDYTINLNHTHENMAKLVVCEESDLPSTLDPATIYAITDSGETEIEKLIIRGMEFAGGGVPDTGEPMISSPSNGSTINLGTNEGSGFSKTITVKGKNLTGDLTVTVGTGLTISYGQSTGQSSVTIPQAQALLGAQVTIAYSGSGALEDGSLIISHGNDVLSSVVVVVVAYVTNGLVFHLDGADATTSQWVDRKGGITFAMNNVTLDGNGGVVFNGTNSYGRYSAASSLGFAPATHTIEVVANIGGTATALLFMQNNSGDLALGMTETGSIIAAVSSAANSEPKRRVANQTRGLQTISFANLAAYKNKGTLSVAQDGNFDPTANAGVFIGARDTARSFLEGTIYQIRVYNRLLTAAEILANQQADIDRYNIQ